MTTDKRPFNLGFFSYLQGSGSISRIYQEALDLFTLSDELGLDTAWVAQHHFGHHGGLPSPLVFFSALAARAQRIGVGTAIISLSLEDPIRVAEDAAVFETIYPGRLQLGLGTGFASDAVMETFGRSGQERRDLYDRAIVRLIEAVEGSSVNADDDNILPEPDSLRQRIWEAPSTVERIIEAGKRGSGILLSRVAIGVTGIPTDVVQRQLVAAYYDALPEGIAPRLALSRTVYPSNDPKAAYRDLAAGLDTARSTKPTGMSLDEEFEHFSVHWGTPADVIMSLAAEPLLSEITDLIFQVQPGSPDYATTREIIRLMATEVAPALGWTSNV